MKLFSVDAETDGLYGPAIAIGAVVVENGMEIDRFEGRIPDFLVTNEWVKKNVLPNLKDMAITHDTSVDLEEEFWQFWIDHGDCMVIAHCCYPVETGLFRRCVERDMMARTFFGPYPAIYDISTLLFINDHNPESVDEYIKLHKLTVNHSGNSHHPVYDALAAIAVFHHLYAV